MNQILLFFSPSIKLCPDSGLDQIIRLEVDSSRGLVQDQDLGLPEEGSGEADQLSLTHGEVLPALGHLVLEPGLEAGDKLGQVRLSQCGPDGLVTVLLKWVQVVSQ